MSDLRRRLREEFREKDYRHGYQDEFLNSRIAAQIRELRKRCGWSQQELAEKIGTRQSGVSRLEKSGYSGWSISTLRRLAEAFDVALSVKFASFGDILNDINDFGTIKMTPPEFAHDPVFKTGVVAYGNVVVPFPGISTETGSSSGDCTVVAANG